MKSVWLPKHGLALISMCGNNSTILAISCLVPSQALSSMSREQRMPHQERTAVGTHDADTATAQNVQVCDAA